MLGGESSKGREASWGSHWVLRAAVMHVKEATGRLLSWVDTLRWHGRCLCVDPAGSGQLSLQCCTPLQG